MTRLAGLAFALAWTACAPADLAGDYDVTMSDLTDDCEIASGPYPTFVMTIEQVSDRVAVQFPLATDYLDRFFVPIATAQGLIAFVDGSRIAGALEGNYFALDDTCGFHFRIDLAAELDADTLHGTLTVSDGRMIPPGCAPQPACATEQALVAIRLTP